MSTQKLRRKFSSEFKKKVVLESLKERDSLSELAKKYEVHANQINTWKKDFLDNCAILFDKKSQQKKEDFEEERSRLLRKVGELEMEKDFLKKKLL